MLVINHAEESKTNWCLSTKNPKNKPITKLNLLLAFNWINILFWSSPKLLLFLKAFSSPMVKWRLRGLANNKPLMYWPSPSFFLAFVTRENPFQQFGICCPEKFKIEKLTKIVIQTVEFILMFFMFITLYSKMCIQLHN